MSSVVACEMYHIGTTPPSPYSSSPYSDMLKGWRGVDRGRVPRSEDAMSRKPDPSADIMARLNATGLLPALEAARTTTRITGTRRTGSTRGSGTRRGMLRPETTDRRFMIHGRRAMSPWQARALGSGEGVVVNPDTMQWTQDPQRWPTGWSASYVTYPGRETIEQGRRFSDVHVSFPEWVQ